jgi:hypothetical protein
MVWPLTSEGQRQNSRDEEATLAVLRRDGRPHPLPPYTLATGYRAVMVEFGGIFAKSLRLLLLARKIGIRGKS